MPDPIKDFISKYIARVNENGELSGLDHLGNVTTMFGHSRREQGEALDCFVCLDAILNDDRQTLLHILDTINVIVRNHLPQDKLHAFNESAIFLHTLLHNETVDQQQPGKNVDWANIMQNGQGHGDLGQGVPISQAKNLVKKYFNNDIPAYQLYFSKDEQLASQYNDQELYKAIQQQSRAVYLLFIEQLKRMFAGYSATAYNWNKTIIEQRREKALRRARGKFQNFERIPGWLQEVDYTVISRSGRHVILPDKGVSAANYLDALESLVLLPTEVGPNSSQNLSRFIAMAIRYGYKDIAIDLLDNRDECDVNLVDSEGLSLLHVAIITESYDMVCRLLDRDDTDLQKFYYNGDEFYPVMSLALLLFDDYRLIDRLAKDKRIDLLQQGSEQKTPFHLALEYQKYVQAQCLIENNNLSAQKAFHALLKQTDSQGQTPIQIARQNSGSKFVQSMLKSLRSKLLAEQSFPLVNYLYDQGWVELIEQLTAQAFLDKDAQGNTPVHLVIKAQDSNKLQAFLGFLSNQTMGQHSKMVLQSVLMTANKEGLTPLKVADRCIQDPATRSTIANQLLSAGAPMRDLNESPHRCESDSLAITLTRLNYHAGLAQLPDEQVQATYRGQTLLHVAAIYGYIEATQELNKKGLELDVKDINGHTPLDIAQQAGHESLANILGQSQYSTSSYLDSLLNNVLNGPDNEEQAHDEPSAHP